MKNNIKNVLTTLRPHLFLVIVSLLFALIYALSSLYIPFIVGQGIDLIIEMNKVDFNGLINIFEKIIILIILATISQYLMSLINNRITYLFTKDLREQTFNKIHRLPLSYLDKHPTGDILSRMISDIDSLSEGLLLGFNQFFTGVVTILSTIVFMFLMNITMAIIVVILTPLSLFVARFIAKKIHHHFRNQSLIKGEQTAFIEEMITGQKVVRAFNKEEDNQAKFEEISSRLKDASLKANFFSSLVNPTTRFVNATVYAIITFIGAMIVIDDITFTTGMLTTFLSYASQYTKPFNDISMVMTELQNALTCANRVYSLLEEKEMESEVNKIDLSKVDGEVKLENVYFSYQSNQKLIENFNLTIKPGMKVAIVGPTGCGKTTLINLLMRFYDVTQGNIYVDSIKVKNISKKSLRSNYGMVLQDTWLRNGTIKENITMGEDFSDEKIYQALESSHALHFVNQLKDGINTIIDENGGNLSQGQKQLLCIARVMVNLPPMLILDEATSSIDTRTELKIQDAFNKMMNGRTSFIVAHRLSTIREADIIIVMNEGHIIEQGNHEELLMKKGFYYNLYNSQFEQ